MRPVTPLLLLATLCSCDSANMRQTPTRQWSDTHFYTDDRGHIRAVGVDHVETGAYYGDHPPRPRQEQPWERNHRVRNFDEAFRER